MNKPEKICVVTGAVKSGIGVSVTERLLKDGFHIIGTYENEYAEDANSFMTENSNIELFEVDHSSRKDIIKFTDSVDRKINGIVNVEMFFAIEDLENFDYELWDKSIAINLSAPNTIIHQLKSNLVNGSSIVTVTSTEAFIGSFGASAYAAAKAAIHNLTKTFANNLGSKNIRANVVAPGWIGGVMDTDEVFNMSKAITPLGRLGSPEEVANVVSFLLSDESSFINGSVITADGGYSGVDTIAKYEYEESLK